MGLQHQSGAFPGKMTGQPLKARGQGDPDEACFQDESNQMVEPYYYLFRPRWEHVTQDSLLSAYPWLATQRSKVDLGIQINVRK